MFIKEGQLTKEAMQKYAAYKTAGQQLAEQVYYAMLQKAAQVVEYVNSMVKTASTGSVLGQIGSKTDGGKKKVSLPNGYGKGVQGHINFTGDWLFGDKGTKEKLNNYFNSNEASPLGKWVVNNIKRPVYDKAINWVQGQMKKAPAASPPGQYKNMNY